MPDPKPLTKEEITLIERPEPVGTASTYGFHQARLLATIRERDREIELLRGAARADDERLRMAAERAGITYVGCDTPGALADRIQALEAEVVSKMRERIQ